MKSHSIYILIVLTGSIVSFNLNQMELSQKSKRDTNNDGIPVDSSFADIKDKFNLKRRFNIRELEEIQVKETKTEKKTKKERRLGKNSSKHKRKNIKRRRLSKKKIISVFDELMGNVHCHVDWNRKTDTIVSA